MSLLATEIRAVLRAEFETAAAEFSRNPSASAYLTLDATAKTHQHAQKNMTSDALADIAAEEPRSNWYSRMFREMRVLEARWEAAGIL